MFFLVSKENYPSVLLFKKLTKKFKDFIFISEKNDLEEKLKKENPSKIFFFHWSYIIPKKIYEKYECINIHTSNLPTGRGGSPLQNQILDGITSSKVNALRMTKDGLDSGPVYCYQDVTLQGNIFDIWLMLKNISFCLIEKIITENLKPTEQKFNNELIYKRRTDNKIPFCEEIDRVYNFIRMLDGEGYPTSYINAGKYKIRIF